MGLTLLNSRFVGLIYVKCCTIVAMVSDCHSVGNTMCEGLDAMYVQLVVGGCFDFGCFDFCFDFFWFFFDPIANL